jgi:hypothetical protein
MSHLLQCGDCIFVDDDVVRAVGIEGGCGNGRCANEAHHHSLEEGIEPMDSVHVCSVCVCR